MEKAFLIIGSNNDEIWADTKNEAEALKIAKTDAEDCVKNGENKKVVFLIYKLVETVEASREVSVVVKKVK